MTKEEILTLAEKFMPGIDEFYTPDVIESFAKEIAKIENEECAEAVEGYRKQRTHDTWYKAEDQIRARVQE